MGVRVDPDSLSGSNAVEVARRLSLKVASVHDWRQRRLLVGSVLEALTAAEIVDSLAVLSDRALIERSPQLQTAMHVAAFALEQALPYDKKRECYQLARTYHHRALACLFFDIESLAVPTVGEKKAYSAERQVQPRGRALTLGERKALARCPRRDLLQQMVRDPHPDVVGIILDNPKLVERDVLALAAVRNQPTKNLCLIAEHPKWGVRPGIKRSIVLNPRTPVPVAARLLFTVSRTECHEVACDEQLSSLLRESARDIVLRTQALEDAVGRLN